MSSHDPVSTDSARQLLAELDRELGRIDARLEMRRRQRMVIVRLRDVCEPHMRDNPDLTVGEALTRVAARSS